MRPISYIHQVGWRSVFLWLCRVELVKLELPNEHAKSFAFNCALWKHNPYHYGNDIVPLYNWKTISSSRRGVKKYAHDGKIWKSLLLGLKAYSSLRMPPFMNLSTVQYMNLKKKGHRPKSTHPTTSFSIREDSPPYRTNRRRDFFLIKLTASAPSPPHILPTLSSVT